MKFGFSFSLLKAIYKISPAPGLRHKPLLDHVPGAALIYLWIWQKILQLAWACPQYITALGLWYSNREGSLALLGYF